MSINFKKRANGRVRIKCKYAIHAIKLHELTVKYIYKHKILMHALIVIREEVQKIYYSKSI